MKNWADPEAKAEAERYDNPIPSRTLILETIEEKRRLYRMRTWSKFLKLQTKKALKRSAIV